MKPSLEEFTPEQATSAVELIRKISEIDGQATQMQADLISDASTILHARIEPKAKWE